MNWDIDSLADVAEVRRWLEENVLRGNGLARRFLRVLDRAAPGTEIATARLVVKMIFRVASQADALLREQYRKAGRPYGDTDAGLERWTAEQQGQELERRIRLN